jgi:hypothetical protein
MGFFLLMIFNKVKTASESEEGFGKYAPTSMDETIHDKLLLTPTRTWQKPMLAKARGLTRLDFSFHLRRVMDFLLDLHLL